MYVTVPETVVAGTCALLQVSVIKVDGTTFSSSRTWADESYEAGSLAEDLEEILASLEEIKNNLTEAHDAFMIAVSWTKIGVGTLTEPFTTMYV